MAAVALAALSGCDGLTGSETYRYRMTVEIETPQGVRSGSTVREVKTTQGMGIPDRSLRWRVRGEAIPIVLPGGTLFALMRGHILGYDYADALVVYHLAKHPELGVKLTQDWKRNLRQIKKLKPAFELTPNEYPELVRFSDKTVPTSIERVEPSNLSDASAAA